MARNAHTETDTHTPLALAASRSLHSDDSPKFAVAAAVVEVCVPRRSPYLHLRRVCVFERAAAAVPASDSQMRLQAPYGALLLSQCGAELQPFSLQFKGEKQQRRGWQLGGCSCAGVHQYDDFFSAPPSLRRYSKRNGGSGNGTGGFFPRELAPPGLNDYYIHIYRASKKTAGNKKRNTHVLMM